MVAAERVRRAVRGLGIPHAWNGPSGLVTPSSGVAALGVGEGTTAEGVIGRADEALYRAKELGRDRELRLSLVLGRPDSGGGNEVAS